MKECRNKFISPLMGTSGITMSEIYSLESKATPGVPLLSNLGYIEKYP
jgi:hypothetical protein